ncbi:putative mitochondrial adenosine monophosphate deaminase-like protein [Leptomonas pyrrhocoris]|uniref:Putative mitochondrial adenosine monophosphate deaminase-like protein n=1 Tax=Leptomonas pyrrhocoris TaxID=157538 RepID=A0A0M9G8I8_LEPPY|nr:putative mitochondrial adenosine monophosphate deaminase-like protein [Leptomonas pyrrhocoris]KPA84853.1 putative mitochondrial adenosine monophosphate deaminase-like protein [Leptomonas pyrrhocoris]|eukprot:XP_015663292.1 putative mitochondrial adenosine monophosphate deaminase-like protein [Leptomonas pyrrhocoris]
MDENAQAHPGVRVGATSVISRMMSHKPPAQRNSGISSFNTSATNTGAAADSHRQSRTQRHEGDGLANSNNIDVGGGRAPPGSSDAAAAPTYHRIMIDGDEGDKDYLTSVGIIANIIQSRQTYKDIDKGQRETPLTVEEVEQRYRDVVSSSFSPSPSQSFSGGGDALLSGDARGAQQQQQRQPQQQGRASASLDVLMGLEFKRGTFTFRDMRTRIVSWEQYVKDIRAVYGAIENGPCLSSGRARVTSIAEKFRLYSLLNQEIEGNCDELFRDGGVYAPCTRVDNNVNLHTSVVAPVLLDYVVTTALEQPRMPLYVDEKTQQPVTLAGYLETGGVHDPRALTVEGLGLHPTLYRNKYLPYDMFDAKLNPAGEFGATLLQAVLSTDGPNQGDLCGVLLRAELERREYQKKQVTATEMALEVHGYHPEEMLRLAAWVRRQGFNKFSRNRWVLAIKRQRPSSRGPNELPDKCNTIGDKLRNLFRPLFMATLCPNDPQWADVAQLLANTGALSVFTHNVVRMENFHTGEVDPDTVPWSGAAVPVPGQAEVRVGGCSDYYFFYYVWANLTSLNALRVRLGLNTLLFTPSVHEQAPAYDQLVCSFLLADVVHHVSSLAKSWIMQFLYMYCRIGIVLSPLRDNALSTAYFDNPFLKYFHQGMRISISTSDPLYFHHNEVQPLMEEYATLCKLCSLSPMDTMELARNSVLNSSFPEAMKREWLGEHYTPLGAQGNELRRCGVCAYRLQFRHETLAHEEELLNRLLEKAGIKAPGGGAGGDRDGSRPLAIHLIPYAQSVLVSDLVQQSRHHSRRMNYTDQRIEYPRIDIYYGGHRQGLATDAVVALRQAIGMRRKYAGNVNRTAADTNVHVEDVFSTTHRFNEAQWEYNTYYGVCILSLRGKTPSWPTFLPTITEFIRDMATMRQVANSVALQRLAIHRLNLLEQKFLLHLSMNVSNEAGKKEEKEWNNRDFFTAYKVDTNVHTDAGSNARTLLEFFVDKALNHGEDVVFERHHHPVTLRELLKEYEMDVHHITVDELHHHLSTHPDLRGIFLSPFNFMQGRYFAELTKRTLDIYEEDAYGFAENRLTITGESEQEWYDLAHWFDRYGMASSRSRWMVCLPWQYRRLRRTGALKNFGEFLDNVFHPLWEISLHPAKDTKFHYLLAHISGFDCVMDESKIDLPLSDVSPHDWTRDFNPPYSYYMYYMWANITTLNEFRASRGLSTFTLRPQCGERGGMDHLVTGFCLANSINHGVTLARHPVLEYMWYIAQVGVAMSPLSNTAGASAYLENPFPVFFHRGLNVSLATNQPMYFHFTREPLVEEYSIAAKLWKFELNDLSEIARNSVLQSGFSAAWKENALGPRYQLRSTLGNDVRRSRVSDIRVAYRYEVYHTELNFLDEQLAVAPPSFMQNSSTSGTSLMDQAPQKASRTSASAVPNANAAAVAAKRMPRAMKTLEEELAFCGDVAVGTLWRGMSVSGISSEPGIGSVSVDRGVSASNAGGVPLMFSSGFVTLESRAEQLKREIQQLDAELTRMRAVSLQVAGQNNSIAMQVNAIRERLRTEGLTILGGLYHPSEDERADETTEVAQRKD